MFPETFYKNSVEQNSIFGRQLNKIKKFENNLHSKDKNSKLIKKSSQLYHFKNKYNV